MNKSVKVEFYWLEMPEEVGLRFEQVLEQIAALPTGEERTHTVGATPLRLQSLESREGVWIGRLVRIRFDQSVLRASIEGELEEVELGPGVGLGTEQAFLWAPDLGVLALQKSPGGVSARGLRDYIELAGDLPSAPTLEKVLREDVRRKFMQMEDLRDFELRVALGEHADPFSGSANPLHSVAELFREYGAPQIAITLKRGTRRGSLDLKRVNEAAKTLLALRDHDEKPVKKIKVMGSAAETEPEKLDLIAHPMVETVEVDLRGLRLDYEACRRAAVDAYQRRRGELQGLARSREASGPQW